MMKPKSDPEAVVDEKLKVYEVDGLKVVDASIMLKNVKRNRNAPTSIIAEEASDIIKKEWLFGKI